MSCPGKTYLPRKGRNVSKEILTTGGTDIGIRLFTSLRNTISKEKDLMQKRKLCKKKGKNMP
jgi:hypothetical protein